MNTERLKGWGVVALLALPLLYWSAPAETADQQQAQATEASAAAAYARAAARAERATQLAEARP